MLEVTQSMLAGETSVGAYSDRIDVDFLIVSLKMNKNAFLFRIKENGQNRWPLLAT